MNWQAELRELLGSGLSVTEIAINCGASRTAISDLLHGYSAEPKYNLALAILALQKRTARKRKPNRRPHG